MKKILGVLAAGIAALSLMGCSGDLHDVELIDLTGYGIIGTETGWKEDSSLLVKQSDGSYKYEFTYKDGDTFAIRNTDWATAYRWDGVAGAKDPVKFEKADTVYKVYAGDSPDCMSLPCATEGDNVVVSIVPAATYLEVTVSVATPEAMYVSVDNAVSAMTPTGTDGEYSYTVTGSGSDVEFKVFDGTDTYGLTKSGYATTSTSLVKDGEAVKISTVSGAKYLIYVTKDDDSISVVTSAASYCYKYGIGYLCSNFGNYQTTWVANGTGFKSTVTIPAGASNTWGGNADADIEFGVCDTESWGTKFTGATLATASKAYDLTEGAGDNNKITGVNPSEKAVTITLVSTDDGITASYAQ